jgi:hypothetical protein
MNCFSQHIMVLSEFHDTFLTIILHFGGDLSDRHRPGAIFLIRRRRWFFSYFAFRYSLIAAFSSKPCHGRPS